MMVLALRVVTRRVSCWNKIVESAVEQIFDPFYNDVVHAGLLKVAEVILDAAERLPRGKRFIRVDTVGEITDLGAFNPTHPYAPIHWAIWLLRQSRVEPAERFAIAPRDMCCLVRKGQKCIGCLVARVPGGEDINVYDVARENGHLVIRAKINYSFRSQ